MRGHCLCAATLYTPPCPPQLCAELLSLTVATGEFALAASSGGSVVLPYGFTSTPLAEVRRQAEAQAAAAAEDDSMSVSAAAAAPAGGRLGFGGVSGPRQALLDALSVGALPALSLAVAEAIVEQTWLHGDLTSLNLALPLDVAGAIATFVEIAAERWEPSAVLALLNQIRAVVGVLQVRSTRVGVVVRGPICSSPPPLQSRSVAELLQRSPETMPLLDVKSVRAAVEVRSTMDVAACALLACHPSGPPTGQGRRRGPLPPASRGHGAVLGQLHAPPAALLLAARAGPCDPVRGGGK